MSNNVLILDAGCQNYGKGGELNHYLSRIADDPLKLTLEYGNA